MALDIRELSQLLAAQIDSLVPSLFPNAKRVGNEWYVGSLAGEPGKSLAIHSGGAKSGVWADFSTDQKGDALKLIAEALYGGDLRRAIAWALSFLGLYDSTPPPSRPRPAPIRQVQQAPERANYEVCRRIMTECRPLAGSLAEIYLQSRGLQRPDEDYDSALRFNHSCRFGKELHPAMIAVMTDAVTNQPVALHRTALAPDGRGKAKIPSPKMMLGSGGVIRLTSDENVTHGLGICEGIETGLAVLQHAGWSPVWATASANGIANFPGRNAETDDPNDPQYLADITSLAGIQCLTIFADADDNGTGMRAARTCAERWYAAGRQVIIQQPPHGADWLDALRSAA